MLANVVANQQGNAFDMEGLREHIDWLGNFQAIAIVTTKRRDIAGQGAGVAGHIADRAWGERLESLQSLRMTTGAWRIDQGEIDAFAAVVDLAEQTFERPLMSDDIALIVQSSISAGIHDCAGLRFDGKHAR